MSGSSGNRVEWLQSYIYIYVQMYISSGDRVEWLQWLPGTVELTIYIYNYIYMGAWVHAQKGRQHTCTRANMIQMVGRGQAQQNCSFR